jgi:Heavy-metal resistance
VKRWGLVIALLLSVGLNLGILAAIAARRAGPPLQPRGGPKPEIATPGVDPLPRLPRLADRLGLEGETRRKFLDIQWNLYQETSRLRLQLGEVHREIRREMIRREPDRQRVDQLLNESARIYLALERSLVRNILATRELLDPEQEREYLALIGRLRVPNPGAGLGQGLQQRPLKGQGPAARLRQRLWEERLRREGRFPERRQRLERDRPEDQGPEEPPVL